jgi:hypothetical protein
MALNPNHNLFSVAPVGNVVVIGRHMAVKTLERPRAMNLLAWLVIATGAKPEEVAALIREANTAPAAPVVMSPPPIMRPTPGPGAQPARSLPAPAAAAPVPATVPEAPPNAPGSPPLRPDVAAAATPFVGTIDAEEKAALAEAAAALGAELDAAERNGKTKAVDADALADAWGSR